AAIGVMAPILVTRYRSAPGFPAPGVYAGAGAYLMEHAPRSQRAWYGSFVPDSTFSAFAAAAVVDNAQESSMSTEAMGSWG
ncbi:MFS transporter, partial [Pseudomonas syringae pv. tagetis]